MSRLRRLFRTRNRATSALLLILLAAIVLGNRVLIPLHLIEHYSASVEDQSRPIPLGHSQHNTSEHSAQDHDAGNLGHCLTIPSNVPFFLAVLKPGSEPVQALPRKATLYAQTRAPPSTY